MPVKDKMGGAYWAVKTFSSWCKFDTYERKRERNRIGQVERRLMQILYLSQANRKLQSKDCLLEKSHKWAEMPRSWYSCCAYWLACPERLWSHLKALEDPKFLVAGGYQFHVCTVYSCWKEGPNVLLNVCTVYSCLYSIFFLEGRSKCCTSSISWTS